MTTTIKDIISREKKLIFTIQVFNEHANKLVEVADLACSMSGNDDGVKMVRYAAAQIENLCPQVRTKQLN